MHRLLILLLLLAGPALAIDIDRDNGREINDTCAGCHGEFGQGGGDGEYPRLAGLPAQYIARQLELFRDRVRPNMAMVEYVDHRQMPDDDIRDVSHYLAGIVLKTRLEPVDENAPEFDALARLNASRQLMQIPRAEGDSVKGARLYRRECGSCHGREGWGDPEQNVPQLAGQYIDYLWRQVENLRNRTRIHDPSEPDDELLDEFSNEELTDIFAYLSIADD